MEPEDVRSFMDVQERQLVIFRERRKKYGSHLANAQRFPLENESGLYLKCVRLMRMIEGTDELDEDTLIDTAVYATMILSAKNKEDGE